MQMYGSAANSFSGDPVTITYLTIGDKPLNGETEKTMEKLNRILAENTGKPLKTVEKDTDRDNYLDADEALAYGIIDKIVEKR